MSQLSRRLNVRNGNTNLSPDEVRHLVSVAGDHSVPEEEWVRACEILGDYQPASFARKKGRRRLTLVLCSITALLVGTVFLTQFLSTIMTAQAPLPNPAISSAPPVVPEAAPAVANPDFGPYMANLQRRIKRGWYPPKGNETKRVVTIFNVDREGHLTKLRISRSSGIKAADDAALEAVANAAPFRKLPPGASKDVDIQFTFDYNVFNNGYAPPVDHSYQAPAGDSFSSSAPVGDRFSSQ